MSHFVNNLVSERVEIVEKGEGERERERGREWVSEWEEKKRRKRFHFEKKGTRRARARLFHFAADKRHRDCREDCRAIVVGSRVRDRERASKRVMPYSLFAPALRGLWPPVRASQLDSLVVHAAAAYLWLVRCSSRVLISFPLLFSTVFRTRVHVQSLKKKIDGLRGKESNYSSTEMSSLISLKRYLSRWWDIYVKFISNTTIDSARLSLIKLTVLWLKILMFPRHSCELMLRNAFFCADLMQRSCIYFERSCMYFLDARTYIFY